jgi:hypothetical protein
METQVKAENLAYDQLSHLGQITLAAFKKEGEWEETVKRMRK